MVTNRDGALELWQAESRSRLTIAVGAHLVPNATDLHVAPTPRAVLRGVVEGLRVQSGHPVVGQQQISQGLPELDQAPPFALPDALARLEQPVLGQPCGRLLGIR